MAPVTGCNVGTCGHRVQTGRASAWLTQLEPLLLVLLRADAVLTCVIQPVTGQVAVTSRPLPTAQGQVPHLAAQLQLASSLPQEQQAGKAGSQPAASGPGSIIRDPAIPSMPPTQPSTHRPGGMVLARSSADPTAALAALLVGGGAAGTAGGSALACLLAGAPGADGYWVHPAVADASLQLAAALRMGQQAGAGGSDGVLVPAGVAAYAAMGGAPGAAGASADAGGRTAGKGAEGSHWLAGSCGGGPVLRVAGSQLRPLRAWAPLSSPAATAAATAGMAMPPQAALATLAPGGHGVAAGAGAPALPPSVGEVQRQLAEVAAGLLGVAEVAPDQPLMEAGLDSIGTCLGGGVECDVLCVTPPLLPL